MAQATSPTATTVGMTNQNLNQIVTDYLLKRGFNRTEEVFRQESKHLGPDGKPLQRTPNTGPKKYATALRLLKEWVDNNLDVYKFELSKLLWPVFVYSFLELVENGYADEARALLRDMGPWFPAHEGDVRNLGTVTLPQHVGENSMARLYRENRYRIPLNQHATGDLFNFLERESEQGGAVVRRLLVAHCQVDSTARGPITPFSFEAVLRRATHADMDEVDAREGVPGVNIGLANRELLDPAAPLKLGPLPMEPELREDVRAELEDEERRRGEGGLVEEFDRKIKREESADAPSRADLPLPPSRPRDIMLEMQKVRENRDRFKIEGRSGGVGAALSSCMFTFHNTLGAITCIDFSDDGRLVAVGTAESYIRVWSLDGKELPSAQKEAFNSRKLIGHSGPVYDVSFSDSASPSRLFGDAAGLPPIDGRPRLLLSCSADGHIRLWSLEAWTCLCVYKSHDGPVYRVLWSPQGHYFASGGYDRTARVWMQDHASPQRLLVGHETPVSALAWHPNGMYVFSASDETDKAIRMWSVVTGQCVRVLVGHADHISALECAPNGAVLASADCAGNVVLWDIARGTRIKRSRGHGRGGVWSLSFSAESTALVSGGQDGTVRVWDVETPETLEPEAPGKKRKDVVTPDQISAFATKKTPVIKVKFTRMNLVMAGGSYGVD